MFLGVFSADWIFSLHCCFFRCFYSTTNFTIAFPIVFISRTFITITVFVRNPAFVLFYRECYGFKRVFFTLTRFLSYTPSWHLAQPSILSRLPWGQQFQLEGGCRISHWGSKQTWPICLLNHTVFSKRY